MKKGFKNVDVTKGRIVLSMLSYVFPIVLANLLQYFYNLADVAIVGMFASVQAVAAVGAPSAIINLIINVLFGLATGSNILISRYVGAKDEENIKKVVNTSFAVSMMVGFFALCIGEFATEPMLRLVDCPENIIESSALYVRIYFIGLPAAAFYNYMSCILRAHGDSKRPLIYLGVSGLVNVVLNVILVACFSFGVVGVAIATVVSQYLSAGMLLYRLIRLDGAARLVLSKIRLSFGMFVKILRYGVPTMIANLAFSVSNVQVQTVVNSYGDMAISGVTAADKLQSILGTAFTSAFATTAATFIGANIGAGDRKRTLRIIACCYVMSIVTVGISSSLGMVLQEQLMSLIIPGAPEAIGYGKIANSYALAFCFMLSIMSVNNQVVQAYGYSVYQMVINIAFLCVFRIFWISLVYQNYPSFKVLYAVYPVSWALAILGLMPCVISCIVRYARGKDFEL